MREVEVRERLALGEGGRGNGSYPVVVEFKVLEMGKESDFGRE